MAIVLDNGPEMACAFITIAQAATTAPLNPAYREEEYAFYLEDLQAKALVVAEDYDGPALAAAETSGAMIVRLASNASGPAGAFRLSGPAADGAQAAGNPDESDVALILHTSGTTSRPKIVPLTQSNIHASANNIRSSLALTSEDRCLNVMPLFHIHGLIAAVASSLAAGACISCAPGFNALRFYAQLEEVSPTWYTAVPSRVGTMDCSIAPLTEPDMRTTHPALWIGPSKCQLKLGRYLRGVKFHPSGFQRYQSSCEPGNRIGPRHARTVGLVPNTPAAIRGTGGSPAARPHCQKMPEKEAGSLLLTHDDSSQPTADMSVEYTQSLDTLFRAEPEVRHPPVEVAAETRHTR